MAGSEQKPGNVGLVPQDYVNVLTGTTGERIMREVGYSSTFGALTLGLQRTLAEIHSPKRRGFDLKIGTDEEYPDIRFTPRIEPAFSIEVMGLNSPDIASVRIRRLENTTAVDMSLSALQEFARKAFPGRNVALEGIVSPLLKDSTKIITAPYATSPESFFDEETTPSGRAWKDAVREAKSEDIFSLLQDFLQPFRKNIEDVTEEDFLDLEEHIEGATVDLSIFKRNPKDSKQMIITKTQPIVVPMPRWMYDDLRLVIEGQKDPVIQMHPVDVGNGSILLFDSLYFSGKAEEVERVVKQATILFQATSGYKGDTMHLFTEEPAAE